MTDIIGTVESLDVKTSKAGKQYEQMILEENKKKYLAFKREIQTAGVKQGDKVRFTTWDDKGLFIDQIEKVPESTQTTIEAPATQPKEEPTIETPDQRTTDIRYYATLKAVASMGIPKAVLSDTEIQHLAENLIHITEKVIALRKK